MEAVRIRDLTELASRAVVDVDAFADVDESLPWSEFLLQTALAAWQNTLAGHFSQARRIACRPVSLQYLRSTESSGGDRAIAVSYLADAAWRLLVLDVYQSPRERIQAVRDSLARAHTFSEKADAPEIGELTEALTVYVDRLALPSLVR